jgi:hypothetical protein
VPEVVLQGLLILGVGVSAVAGNDQKSLPAKRLADGFVAILVVGMLVPPALRLLSLQSIDWPLTARTIGLPIGMSLVALPFVYVLALYASYETTFVRLAIANGNEHPNWTSRVVLIAAFRGNYGEVQQFVGRWPWELVHAKGWRASWRVVQDQRAALLAEDERKRDAAQDLVRYAGVVGTDPRGGPLDKREFKETVHARETLASSHMGWYRSHGDRYQTDLLERFADVYAKGLPADHGIKMTVSGSGQSWYAWRRTPSGLVFGIGASGPPPDQRFFEGMEPPRSFPKPKGGDSWSRFDRGPNWMWVEDPDDKWLVEDEVEPE